jgi:cellulose synthase operon protein B
MIFFHKPIRRFFSRFFSRFCLGLSACLLVIILESFPLEHSYLGDTYLERIHFGWAQIFDSPALAQAPEPTQSGPTPATSARDTAKPDVGSTADFDPDAPKINGDAPQRLGEDPLDSRNTLEAKPSLGNQYILEFNRSPVVANRLRLEGIYNEARLRFTRPRHWQIGSLKLLLRYRHSAALYATRSNLNVLVNGVNIGGVPLNKKQNEIGTVIFDIPADSLQDYNEIVLAGLQNNSPTCTQDPFDPSLWTEILPDSKLVFDFAPQPYSLDFNNFPYPLIDVLSLEPNQISYVLPSTLDQPWLTGAARLQAALGRIADYRPLQLQLRQTLAEAQVGERLVVMGTPAQQAALNELTLPIALKEGQWHDPQNQPIGDEVGIVMWAALKDNQIPVLVITGNSSAAVSKAVQFLVQSQDRKIGAGQLILVEALEPIETPDLRAWPRYLPVSDAFALSDLKTVANQAFEDVTIRGAHAPPLEFDFRALPDDRFGPGNVMTLRYSYGPQVNPLTSLVEVQLDGITVAGRRLTQVDGQRRETLKVELPESRITPHSRMQVFLRFDPRERRSCSRVTDHQLWGTIHADTNFQLNREQVAKLPDLKLLQAGYPFASPQDISRTAIVLSDQPTQNDLMVFLEMSERLGRLSRSESVAMLASPVSALSPEIRQSHHLIGIGVRSQFPFPEVFESAAFSLRPNSGRQWGQSQVQTLPDAEGVVQQQLSPWNPERVLLSLSAQTEEGLTQVRDLLDLDSLFFQLEGDTVLISANERQSSPYDASAYNLESLQRFAQREIRVQNRLSRYLAALKGNWMILLPGMVALSLLLYAVGQAYLKRMISEEKVEL